MVLFVCTGNTCRSPLAEAIARARGVDAASAGLAAAEGRPASPGALLAAVWRGIDLSGHRSRPVSRALIEQADQVFTMTADQAQYMARLYPEARAKIHALSPDIPDPWGGSDADYERCAEAIGRALARAGILPSER